MEEIKESIEVTYAKDIAFIDNEVITKLPCGEYCKYSKILKGISVTNMTKQQYVRYWTSKYNRYPNFKKQIQQKCEDKLLNGLLPISDMIQLVNNSKDTPKEKQKVLKLLSTNINN